MAALFLAPIYILINVYIVQWIFRWMGSCHYLFRTSLFRILFSGAYIFLAAALLTGFLIQHPAAIHRLLKNIGNYFLGIFLYILMTVAVLDLGRLVLKYVFHASWISSRTSFVITGTICVLLILTVSIYGIVHTTALKVTPYDVTVSKKAEGLDSLKIVLVADTHFGYSAGARHAWRIVRKINEQNPDLVCFAGDIFDNELEAIAEPEEVKKALLSIRSVYGTYACWGNHDLEEAILAGFTFSGGNRTESSSSMEDFLKDCHIRLLDDEAVLIDNAFYVVGRKDLSRSKKLQETRKTPAQLTESLDRRKPVIFIDHQPKELEEVSKAGADLDLCGHTHNGQIFPGNLAIRFFWENSCGSLQKGSMHNIVTSGAGVWGPNMRVGTDSEICPITIHFLKRAIHASY